MSGFVVVDASLAFKWALRVEREDLLSRKELAALDGTAAPHGVIIE